MDGAGTPIERMHRLDHLSPLEAAKAWGVPKPALKNAAEQIRQIRAGTDRSLASDRPRCPEPVASFYGFPCKAPVESGMDVCYQHRRVKANPGTDVTSYALAAVQAHASWEELRESTRSLDKGALQSERLRLFKAFEAKAPMTEEDYRLASLLLPSDDPATQARRALGLPGPNDGIGDGARLRGLGVLLAAAEAAALNLPTALPQHTPTGCSTDDKPKSDEPLLHSVTETAKSLGVGVAWLRSESAAGRVPHRQIGSHRMFSEDDLAQIVKDAYRPSSGKTRGRRW
ncbi:helix-turn-helix domain-containing protein [Kitasatospora sp. NPDC094011]|uniref:helix-turn-helix domain-containing protein n=1 Tax=Kitasatospora sp. NPDC094011 TaxID=3364090 RepID=UPI00382B21D5